MTDRPADKQLTPEPTPTDAPTAPARPRGWRRLWAWAARQVERTVRWFREQDPTFVAAFTPALFVAVLLYVRSPASNYIFDEQEALLANPYVNGQGLGYWDAFSRDFWGLPPTRSIGSYRPIPNLIWRALWVLSDRPWLHHWVNVVFHAVNAALISSLTLAVTKQRKLAWLSGATFLLTAVLTEAVTGVVGIADVLGGCGVLLALVSLRLPLVVMPLGVFTALAFGLLCKESGLVALPLVPWAALVLAPMLHPRRPWRLLRALLALVGAAGALIGYTYFRRHFFPVSLPAELQHSLPDSEPLARRALHEFLRWFQQPRLPRDPINNPLVTADFPHRVAGALRVYWRGITQVFLPLHLSGDYSFPQEPVPARLFGVESVLGGCAMLCPPLAAVGYWVYGLVRERRERRAHREATARAEGDSAPATPSGPPAWSGRLTSASLVAVGLLWVPVAYFPHSNIPVLLPTVRAERFWYLPAVGSAWIVAVLIWWLLGRTRWRRLRLGVVGAFFCVQAVQARLHALDYTNDLVFWRSTRRSVPNSAKAHLNYSVMVGARGRLDERLQANRRAIDLAPQWAMAHVYYGDTLCRLKRPDEAWPHYVRGFELDPNSQNLVALALQCLWDKKAIEKHEQELLDLSDEHPGTWLSYLGHEIVYNGAKHGGVEKKYRPRGYDQGPKKR